MDPTEAEVAKAHKAGLRSLEPAGSVFRRWWVLWAVLFLGALLAAFLMGAWMSQDIRLDSF